MTMTIRWIAGISCWIVADSSAAAPAGKYESVFSDYKPFVEEKLRSWTEVNQEVAENPMGHAMGAMKGMPSKPDAPGHDMGAMKGMPPKANAPGHDMGAMKGMPPKADAPGHDMGAMKGMPPKADAPGHDMGATKEATRKPALAMVSPHVARGRTAPSLPANVMGTGVVQAIDKVNARIKLTHDPIAALNWPRLTLYFRLKDRALADRVKEGERVGFSLERHASGFVIADFHKPAGGHDAK